MSGVVKESRGLVWIVAEELVETSPQAEKAPEQIVSSAPAVPPEVLFSAPTNDETDVPLDTKIRVQFSRDINPDTLKGNVSDPLLERAGHRARRAAGALARREAELQPRHARAGDRLRGAVGTVPHGQAGLGEGIMGTDGLPLKPYSLTFHWEAVTGFIGLIGLVGLGGLVDRLAATQ